LPILIKPQTTMQNTRAALANPFDALFEQGRRELGYVEYGDPENPRRIRRPAATAGTISLDDFIEDGSPNAGVFDLAAVVERPAGMSAQIDVLETIKTYSRVVQAGAMLVIAAPRDKFFPVSGGKEPREPLWGWYKDAGLVRVGDPAPFASVADKTTGMASLVASNAGEGYTDGTYALTVTNAPSDTTGAGAAATATVVGGTVVSTTITADGQNYTAAPTFALPAGAGTPATAAAFTATIGAPGSVSSSLWPFHDALISWPDAPNYSFSTTIDRAQNAGIGGGTDLRRALLVAILRGLGELCDQVHLNAIAAGNPAAFTMGAAAAKHLEIDDLRALIGTNGNGAASPW
jgi:hypothetical protein